MSNPATLFILHNYKVNLYVPSYSFQNLLEAYIPIARKISEPCLNRPKALTNISDHWTIKNQWHIEQ
jgi:hypothetical protein